MKGFLQLFGFKESRYDRPNQEWVCGPTPDGKACPCGPDAQGRCGATSECAPLRKGDRWFCTRPTTFGGPCAEGPAPDGTCCRTRLKCAPVRSVRTRRALTVQLTVALTIGLLLMVFGLDTRWRSLSPGPLTTAHAISEATCADCHSTSFTAGTERFGLLHGMVASDRDNQHCLNCHQLGTQPLSPHGLPVAAQALLTAKANLNPSVPRPAMLVLSTALIGRPTDSTKEFACSTCHQEHLGKDHALSALADAKCQTCHQRPFQSFAAGHPAFTDYPYARRTRIFFDHTSHLSKHFQDAKSQQLAPQYCTDCHQPDDAGRTMLVKNFAASCASCHQDQIRGEGRADSPGIAVLRVPGLDALSLSERDRAIGDWPEQAEGRVTPFMQLLLATDPANTAALAKLSKTDCLDLTSATDEELAAAERVAWAVKDIFYDLVTKGQAAWRARLQAALGRELTPAEFAPLANLLPPELLSTAQTEWFPHLLTEVPAHRAGQKSSARRGDEAAPRTTTAKTLAPEKWVAHGGWYLSRNDHALLYRPVGHADEFLHAWLDLAADQSGDPTTATAAIFKQLAAPLAPGLCTKCHSTDRRPEQTQTVNWHPARPVPNEHSFTKFSHDAHFSLLDQKGCITCHQLNAQAEYQQAFKDNLSPALFTSNFSPMQKAVCAECHTPAAAGDTCLKCHAYHVGNFTPTLSKQARTRRMFDAPP